MGGHCGLLTLESQWFLYVPQGLTFKGCGWTLHVECEYHMNQKKHFVRKRMQIVQHVVKISLLSNYIK